LYRIALRSSDDVKEAWAALLGEGNEPHFAGIVKGSAVLRASVPSSHRLATKVHLLSAQSGVDEHVTRSVMALADMRQRDKATVEGGATKMRWSWSSAT